MALAGVALTALPRQHHQPMIFRLFDVVTVKPLTRDPRLWIVAMLLCLLKSQTAVNNAVAFVEVWSVEPNNGISLHDKKSARITPGRHDNQ